MKAFLAGLGTGIVMGVLFAPKSGQMAGDQQQDHSDDREHEFHTRGRDPEARPVDQQDKESLREKMLDKTLADSFPTSDPPSSIPDPSEGDSFAA
jgi:hypothetical protein